MNSLPIESTRWREHLKQRIGLETAILRALIQWGMAESASEVCRSLEEYFGDVLESQLDASLSACSTFRTGQSVCSNLLRETYLRTREIPRRRVTQERLHDGLLTGFEALSLEIFKCYEAFLFRPERSARSEKAA